MSVPSLEGKENSPEGEKGGKRRQPRKARNQESIPSWTADDLKPGPLEKTKKTTAANANAGRRP